MDKFVSWYVFDMDNENEKAMDMKIHNALTAKEAKEISDKSVDSYVEQWLPEIMAEIFAQIRVAASNQKTYINDLKVLDDYLQKDHLYKCIKTYMEEIGYAVSENETNYNINISWYNAK